MRLLQARRLKLYGNDGRLLRIAVVVEFSAAGVTGRVELEPPGNWEQLTRPQKIAWVKQQVTDHLAGYVYEEPDEVIFPDKATRDQAADDFEALPGWATWTAEEAEAFIHDSVFNGNDLTTVQAQIDALPANIAGMRAGLKNAADAIIQLRANQERIVKAIVLLRDRTIER